MLLSRSATPSFYNLSQNTALSGQMSAGLLPANGLVESEGEHFQSAKLCPRKTSVPTVCRIHPGNAGYRTETIG